MCGRFILTTSRQELEEKFGIPFPDFNPRYNIAPSQEILSIVVNEEGWKAGFLQWGLVPVWAKDKKIGYKMINARGETLDEKPAFKRLLSHRRCLIVADGFYEWMKLNDRKQPYRITVDNGKAFTFAGLWDRWKSEDEEIVSCTIITTKPNKLMDEIHDRMPVILNEEERDIWLNSSIEDKHILKDLIKPYPAEEMNAHEVSTIVNSPKNEVEDCIRPLA